MGFTEILFILVIYLLLFGAKGMPSLARNLGKAMREVRRATSDIQREMMDGVNDIKKDFDTDARSKPQQGPKDQAEIAEGESDSTSRPKPMDQPGADASEKSSPPGTTPKDQPEDGAK